MKMNKELNELVEENNLQYIINDIEKISKEINENKLDIVFEISNLDAYSRVGKLVFYTKENKRIIAAKNYDYTSLPISKYEFELNNDELLLK